MRIAQLAPLWKPVPPPLYGGSELVVSNLTNSLVKLGHEVTLFACGGSQTSGNLVQVIDRPLYDLMGGFTWHAVPAYEFLSFYELFSRLDEFDIVHNHMGLHPLVFSTLLKIPMVTTLHSSLPSDYPYLEEKVKNCSFISISEAQKKLYPALNFESTVYHGINTDAYPANTAQPDDYYLFVGSLTKNKGIDLAVSAAKELGLKLVIAGEIRAEDKAWLDEKVFPFVDGKTIRFIGEVGEREKAQLYANAIALLFPTQWNEAFGLVMIEANASGTPVIAYDNGAVSEVIEDGKTGRIVSNYRDFLLAIADAPNLSRALCAETARLRFDSMTMAKNYVTAYNKIIQKKL